MRRLRAHRLRAVVPSLDPDPTWAAFAAGILKRIGCAALSLVVVACASSAVSPAPHPTPSVPPTAPASRAADSPSPRPTARLVLRVDIRDEGAAVWPTASYYDDGRVLMPGAVGEVVVRRLTTSGLVDVLRSVELSGLFDRPRQFVALDPNRGLTYYMVDLALRAQSPVRVRAAINAEVTGDAAQFVQLASDLADPVGSLPPSAWSDIDPVPFIAAVVRLGTVIEEADGAPMPVDIGDVRWPLQQPFDRLGEVLWEVPGAIGRCAVLSAPDVDAIRAAFAAAGAVAELDPVGTIALRYGSDRTIRFEFVDLLPDGAPGCVASAAEIVPTPSVSSTRVPLERSFSSRRTSSR